MTEDNDNSQNQTQQQTERKPLKICCPNCHQKLDVTSCQPFSHVKCPACSTDLIVPKWFDCYLLEEPGGVGGTGTVFRALDIALDREVAIKVLKDDFAQSPARTENFLREARTAATINHRAVVPIYTCGTLENKPYIVMQYMSGGSLEQQLKSNNGNLPVREAATWMRNVAEGLQNAQQHGIIHHDVKPANIMLDDDRNAKICDFGIAEVFSGHDDSPGEASTRWLSPHYVSPEKVVSRKEDYKGDIYSLGATMYHIFTGKVPFNSTNLDELLRMRLNSQPVEPAKLRPELGKRLSCLIMAMMNREPDDRPEYHEIIDQLNAVILHADKQIMQKQTTPGVKKERAQTWKNFLLTPIFLFSMFLLLTAVGLLLFLDSQKFFWSAPALPPEEIPVQKKTEKKTEVELKDAPTVKLPDGKAAMALFDKQAGAFAVIQMKPASAEPEYEELPRNTDTTEESDDAEESENRTASVPEKSKADLDRDMEQVYEDDSSDTGTLDFSSKNIARLFEMTKECGRPIPKSPAKLPSAETPKYLSNVPEKNQREEKRRYRIMLQLRAFLAAHSVRNGFPVKEFSTRNGKKYRNVEFRFAQDKVTIRGGKKWVDFSWNELSWQQLRVILNYYARYMERQIREGQEIRSPDFVRKLARTYAVYALFCAWYGDYESAEQTVRHIQELCSPFRTMKTNQYLQHLFLQ